MKEGRRESGEAPGTDDDDAADDDTPPPPRTQARARASSASISLPLPTTSCSPSIRPSTTCSIPYILHHLYTYLLATFFRISPSQSMAPSSLSSSMFSYRTLLDGKSTMWVDTLTRKSLRSTILVPVSVAQTKTEVAPLEKIKTGFLKFKEYYKREIMLFKQLAASQSPPFMIISCADSRVDPCRILSLDVGEAFVVRNVANLIPAYTASTCSSTAAAIEFAVLQLKVRYLMVIGHSRCGGIRALMGMEEDGSNRSSDFIEDWVLIGKDVSGKVKKMCASVSFDQQCTHCEKESVNHSLLNSLTFPFVREKVEKGELTLYGAYYDFVNGSFECWKMDSSKPIEVEKFE